MTTHAIELRCGDWRDVLADVGEVDALITDPPYSKRTHTGHDNGARSANDIVRMIGRKNANGTQTTAAKGMRRPITYESWTADSVEAFVAHWSPRTRGWMVACTDHVLAPAWERAYEAAGRYVFAPLQFMHVGSRIRLTGDGPTLWSVTIVVARPATRKFQHWGALPGGYVLPVGYSESGIVVGAKPLWLMRALVRDYSRPGDLVVDPCAGGATTLIAAAIEGRRAIGAELDPRTHALALKRIARGYTPTLFDTSPGASPPPTAATQVGLFDSAANGGKRGE